MVIRVREILRWRVQRYSLPNPELMILWDPSLTPNPKPCLTAVQVQGRRAPDDKYFALYMARKAWDDIHQWCKGCIIECYTSSRTSSTGDKWWETGHTHKLQASEGHTTNFKTLDPRAVGQRAARDIYMGINLLAVYVHLKYPVWQLTVWSLWCNKKFPNTDINLKFNILIDR